MKIRSIHRLAQRKSLLLVGVSFAAVAALIGPIFSVRSNSVNRSLAPAKSEKSSIQTGVDALKLRVQPSANVPFLAPPSGESIATYDSTCTTPRDSFNLGETVCAIVTGAPVGNSDRRQRRIAWVSPYGSLAQGAAITTDPQNGFYSIPATATQTFTDAGGGTTVVDNRGVWRVSTMSALDGSLVTSAFFTVHDPAKEFVDLSVLQGVSSTEGSVGSGSGSVFRIFVTNRGPDTAHDVVLSDTIPANATFSSVVQDSGPTFTCGAPDGGVFTCTITSLAAGAEAEFTFAYDTPTGTPEGTLITNVVTISSSDTPCASPTPSLPCELASDDNTSTATATVPFTPGAETCTLICHENFSVIANTTQGGNPGAVVNFTATGGIFGSCGIITATPASGSFFGLGTTVVNVNGAIDTNGDGIGDVIVGSCSFTVTVVQGTPPTITCPPDKSATADSGGNPPTQHTFTAEQIGTPTTNPPDNVIVTFERSDNIPPTYNDDGSINNPGTVYTLTDPFSIGTTGITWTVTDANGLKASCTQRIVVNGTCPDGSSAPTITAPANINTSTGPNSTTCGVVLDDELGQPVVNDSTTCPATVTVSGIPPGNLFPIGTTTLTYTASNAAGTATATQQVTVSDNTPPVIFAPANASYTCPAQVPALSPSQAFGPNFETGLPDPTKPVFDNCGPPTVTATQTTSGVGSGANPLIITRTYSALDSHGNTASAVQVITVTDNTPPTITAPANVTAYTGAGATTCDTVVSNATLGTASASDNCAGVQVSRSPSGNTFPVGVTTVVWTATDWAGNTATANQTVTVIDNTPPLISCPSSQVLEPTCPSGAIATWTAPVGTDNCPGATTSQTAGLPSGSVFPIGVTTTVTYTVNDAHGNSASCSFTVRVKTVQQTIQDMMAAVSALQPPLTGTQVQGLNAKLQAALDAINQGKTNVACNKLSDFISQVSAYINNGTLTSAQGTPLINSANHVRNTIGCTNNPCS